MVDPFVGRGDLFSPLWSIFDHYYGYDIDPDLCTEMGWSWNDSLDHMPFHPNALVVTNPPYLAKNSAVRNKLDSALYFSGMDDRYEDLYQIALDRVLNKYQRAVFIIPETYFQTELWKSHLHSYTIIEENPFTDTDCPVCVACFEVNTDLLEMHYNNYSIYKNNELLFDRFELTEILYEFNSTRLNAPITFNDPKGNLGLRGVDGVKHYDRIRFCRPEDLDYDKEIKESSRSITLINVHDVDVSDDFIAAANFYLRKLRRVTYDVVLSPFKNNNDLGKRRRRLDYKWARKIIEKTMETLDK